MRSEEAGAFPTLAGEGSAGRSAAAFEAELRPLLRPALRLATGMLADSFEAEDAAIYFGRDDETRAIIEKLAAQAAPV